MGGSSGPPFQSRPSGFICTAALGHRLVPTYSSHPPSQVARSLLPVGRAVPWARQAKSRFGWQLLSGGTGSSRRKLWMMLHFLSLLLFPYLIQLQKCGSPAHMSQAKLKSLEGRKEVRETNAHVFPVREEPGLLRCVPEGDNSVSPSSCMAFCVSGCRSLFQDSCRRMRAHLLSKDSSSL